MATTHGMYGTPEYNVWFQAKQRCVNPNHKAYPRYGGRGIVICDQWKHSFETFYADMGPRPAGPPRYTLERLDNDGPYSPENCTWSTYAAQRRNTRTTRLLTHDGRTQCMQDWANELNMSLGTIFSRLENGWPVAKALTVPPLKIAGKREKDSFHY